jgi:hypothetical protein
MICIKQVADHFHNFHNHCLEEFQERGRNPLTRIACIMHHIGSHGTSPLTQKINYHKRSDTDA